MTHVDRFCDTAVAKHVDAACDEFERAWLAGRQLRVEDFVAEQVEPLRSELLVELLQLEWELRQRDRQQLQLAEYVARFLSDADLVHRALADLADLTKQEQILCPDCGIALTADKLDDVGSCPSCGQHIELPHESTDSSRDSTPSSVHGRFLPGRVLANRYRIVSLLGRGGMGEVYRADDLKLGHTVALKFLPKTLGSDTRRQALFHDEVRLSRQISHPNVCRVYDIAEVDGRPFLSMEYVDGEDFRSLLRRIGKLPRDKSTDIARQLCAALAAAHDCGVLHRDLKPANVMLDGRGRVKITDFGLARVQSDKRNEFVGTPAYMAPEQLLRGETSIQSDIYSLGAVLYEILVGKPLHTGPLSELRKHHQQRSSPLTPSLAGADVDPTLERIVLQCLEPNSAARPQSVAQVAAALPGGDLWTALRAAGDTPSPALLATASEGGSLSKSAALTSLMLVVAGLLVVALFADQFTLFGLANPRSPQSLILQEIPSLLSAFGCDERNGREGPPGRRYRAYGFNFNSEAISPSRNKASRKTSWQGLRIQRTPVVYFWYRQSRRPLIPNLFRGETIGLRFRRERVSENNPSANDRGMISLRLDSEGELLQFTCDPAANRQAPWFESSDDIISATFERAGLDVQSFQQLRAPPVRSLTADEFYAWTEDVPTAPRTVEAATFRKQLVYFNVMNSPFNQQDVGATQTPHGNVVGFVFAAFSVILLSGYFCNRHIRMGRGDRRTAWLLAAFAFIISVLEWLCLTSHAPYVQAEFDLLISGLSFALFFSFLLWLHYLAGEPYVRRRWPESITTWCRLFEGRIWDPAVGRDVLLGTLGGVVSMVVVALLVLLPSRLGYAATLPFRYWDYDTLHCVLSPRTAIGCAATLLRMALMNGIGSLVLLFILRLLLRKMWLALPVFICVAVVMRLQLMPPYYFLIIAIWCAIGLWLLVRYGVVACTTWLFVFFLLSTPLTADVTRWYFGYGLFYIAIVLGCATYGFCATMAGRPLISDAQLSGS